MRLRAPSLLRVYPPGWRVRYGDEMAALIDGAPLGRRERFDLLRGAVDAWIHPLRPSWVPVVAALFGGGIWTALAAGVVFQPVPAQWPGYLTEILAFALVAAACLLVATLGCSLRTGDAAGRPILVAVAVATVGYLGWMVALAATATGTVDGPTLAAGQTIAMIGTAFVGAILVRVSDAVVGGLVMLGPIAMLTPWTVMWLVFGAAWTTVGVILLAERTTRNRPI